MNNFSDFNIAPVLAKKFVGDKIQINNVLNVSIRVLDFKIEPSKKKEGTDYLHLQIEKGGDKRVIFVGSKNLIEQIKLVPRDKFPFTTTIRLNGQCEFT